MSSYLSEDEQVEALKKWWKENGTSVIGGAVIGFAAIFGWQGWDSYQTSQGENASVLFSNMETQMAAGQQDQGMETAKRLIGEYGDSVYATFASLQLAKLAYEKGEKDVAVAQLRWSLDNAADPTLVELARLRLARVLLDMQQTDEAAKLVAAASRLMAGEFAELRGDIARSQGDLAAAREAYQMAIAEGVNGADLVQMKLVDLGNAEPAS